MKTVLSYYLEPIAFLIYFSSFFLYIRKADAAIQYKVLGGYYLVAALLMVIAIPLHFNPPMYNLLYLATMIGVGYFFYATLHTRLKKNTALFFIFVTIAYYGITHILFGFDQVFDSIGYVLTSTGIVVLIFLYLHQLLNNVKEEPLSHNFDFWFISILLIYHLGSFAIFLSYNYFTNKFFTDATHAKEISRIVTYLWILHNVILFLSAAFTSFGMLWTFRRKSPSS